MPGKTILKIQKIDFQWEMENPFLFCAHHKDAYPKGNAEQGVGVTLAGRNIGSDFSRLNGFSMYHGEAVPGFPVHPHRGFETVTIVLEGFVDHFDSKGSAGRYGNGDVQWLTTGAGCQHAEMFPLVNQDRDNPLELFQIWLNLPAKDKFTEPDYKMLWAEEIPVVETRDEKGAKTTVRLISGRLQDRMSLESCKASWAYDASNHVGIYLIRMEAGASFSMPAVSATLVRNLYYYQGSAPIEILGMRIEAKNRIKLNGNEMVTVCNGPAVSELLLLEGEPIQEPVAHYGPFVMNTQKEIQEAFNDYHKTGFGGWPWDRPDPVHPRETGRFARHADGREEHP